MATSSSLRAEPAFVRWAAAEGVSLLGSSVTTVVLPLVVYEATGSAAQTGALYALRVVPYLLFGLIAGPIADRGNRRRLIMGGNIAEGVLVATIPVAHLLGILTISQIYIVSLLSATAFVFSDAAVFGAVPALVGPTRLAAANGLLSSMTSFTEIIGPVIAGVLVAVVGTTNAIWVDAASFLVAAAVQSTIRSNFRTADPHVDTGGGLVGHIGRAFTFIRHHRTVGTLLVAGFGNSFAFGIVLGLLVPFAVERLDVPSGDGRIGLLFGALGVGSLIASSTFSRTFRPGRVRFLSPLSLLCSALFAAGLTASSHWVLATLLIACFSLSITSTIMIGITYRQLVSPDDLRSSVNVIGRMIAWGGQPFGAGVGATLAAVSGVRTAYSVAAGVMLAASIGAALSLARNSTAVASDLSI